MITAEEINTLTPQQKAEFLIGCLDKTLAVLKGLPLAELGEHIGTGHTEKNLESYRERQTFWRAIYNDIANDIQKHINQTEEAKRQITTSMPMIHSAIRLFNGKEVKEATDQLERFVAVAERFQKLKKEGFLDAIIETMGRV